MNLHEMFERTVAAESGPPPQPNAPCWCASGEPYRDVHARMNRATGAKSVGAATVDQLERANALLVKELRQKL